MSDHQPVEIYKILTAPEWLAFQTEGIFSGAPIDLQDGYIHFSDASQVSETLAKHFCGQAGLWLLQIETQNLLNLKWEVSRDGLPFPHLYDRLSLAYVKESWPLSLDQNGLHILPFDSSSSESSEP